MNSISYQQIREAAPAVFAQEPAPGLSGRYRFISTLAIIDALGDLDWFPVKAFQGRSKDSLHATHQITFRKLHPLENIQVGDLIPQLTYIGNHQGRKASELGSGFERLACLNGLALPTGLAEDGLYQIHRGLALANVENALARATGALDEAILEVEQWKRIQLGAIEKLVFAYDALSLRTERSGHANQLLTVNREADQGNDLWTVFNVVQENLTRGGVPGVFSRRRKLRGVTGISTLQKLNQGLWGLARRVAAKLGR